MILSIAAFWLVVFRQFFRPFFSVLDELLVKLQGIDLVVSADSIYLVKHFFLFIFSFLNSQSELVIVAGLPGALNFFGSLLSLTILSVFIAFSSDLSAFLTFCLKHSSSPGGVTIRFPGGEKRATT